MSSRTNDRGGTRGGQDQFKWNDVKGDKHRENYLGNSIMAPVGRSNTSRDAMWYSRDTLKVKAHENTKRAASELAMVKAAEEEAMKAALGLKAIVKQNNSNNTALEITETKAQLGQLMAKITTQNGDDFLIPKLSSRSEKTTSTKKEEQIKEHEDDGRRRKFFCKSPLAAVKSSKETTPSEKNGVTPRLSSSSGVSKSSHRKRPSAKEPADRLDILSKSTKSVKIKRN